MNRSFVSALAAAAFCAAVLCSCGSSSSAASSAVASSAAASVAASAAVSSPAAASADLDGILQGILEKDPISNQFAFTDNTMNLDLTLTAGSYTGYAGVKSNDNGDAGTVVVIEAADGQADSIVSALEAYRDAQSSQLANYPEFADAQANMDAAVIEANGNTVIMAVASNECLDASALQAAVDAALA